MRQKLGLDIETTSSLQTPHGYFNWDHFDGALHLFTASYEILSKMEEFDKKLRSSLLKQKGLFSTNVQLSVYNSPFPYISLMPEKIKKISGFFQNVEDGNVLFRL